jgi:hypothetical protein
MVGRGEVLERMTTVALSSSSSSTSSSEPVLLEALWQGGGIGAAHGTPVLFCPPHPRLGGSMDSAVLAELVWNLGRRRHPTLRFNYRGVGASRGAIALPPLPRAADHHDDVVDLGPLVEDATAALAHLLASTGARTAFVVGVSVGAVVAARLLATHDGVEAGVLVAPPSDALGPAGVIDVDALVDAGVAVTVVVGSDDRVVDATRLEAMLRPRRGPGIPLQVVPGADHLFQRGLTELARRTVAALGGDAEP